MHEKNDSGAIIKNLASFPKLNSNPVLEINKLGRVIFANNAAKKSLKNQD